MARGKYVFTPARRAALAKAQRISAERRRSRGRASRGKRYSSDPAKRGVGLSGARKNFVPYARVNKRSQTGGFNVGTILPGKKKRLVVGGYVRIENTGRTGGIDRALSKAGKKVAPHGTGRGRARKYLKENVTVTNPAVRARVPGGQARLSTSRGAGPTITYRRGSHKTPQKLSQRGVKKYDQHMKAIAGRKVKKSRPQRRG